MDLCLFFPLELMTCVCVNPSSVTQRIGSQMKLLCKWAFIFTGPRFLCPFFAGTALTRFRAVVFYLSGTSVIQVTATDADDPTYGNSARVVYSILQGQPYFSVDSRTGNFIQEEEKNQPRM